MKVTSELPTLLQHSYAWGENYRKYEVIQREADISSEEKRESKQTYIKGKWIYREPLRAQIIPEDDFKAKGTLSATESVRL